MGMTIEEAIETIKGNRWIACFEKYQEAMNIMENTMHKYQTIVDIVTDDYGYPSDLRKIMDIREVIEDATN